MESRVRPARPADHAVPELLYVSAAPYYDAFAGSPGRARRLLRRLYPIGGHTASHEQAHVAELDRRVAGVLVAFGTEEGDELARRFLRLAVPRLPVWRWPGIVRHLRASATVTPVPPPRALYVDALAVAEDARRRGVALELLAYAEARARARALEGVALDTGLQNTAAQALYAAAGFEQRTVVRAPDERTARTVGGPGFVSYFKRV
jgi:ribosomal protein S18 acetylase RimI-like enzyme